MMHCLANHLIVSYATKYPSIKIETAVILEFATITKSNNVNEIKHQVPILVERYTPVNYFHVYQSVLRDLQFSAAEEFELTALFSRDR